MKITVSQAMLVLRDAAHKSCGESAETWVSRALAELVRAGHFGPDVTYKDLWPRDCETSGVWYATRDYARFDAFMTDTAISFGLHMRVIDALVPSDEGCVLAKYVDDSRVSPKVREYITAALAWEHEVPE